MNKKLLSVAIAAAVAAPMAAQAEIKLSGAIQAEIGNVKPGNNPSVSNSNDGTGALYGGGPNRVRLDFSESLGGGMEAFGRVDQAFNTTSVNGPTANQNNTFSARERYVGLKSSGAYFRMGRIQGAYKTTPKIDPFYSTAGQMRMGGGESNGAFGHSSFLNNVVELGFSGSGFKVALQGIFDEANGAATGNATAGDESGSMLANASFSSDMFTVYGAYSNNNDSTIANGNDTNWKLGAKFAMGGLGLGLQYEDAEMGAGAGFGISKAFASSNPGRTGQYISGSATYGLGGITLAGWVSQFSDDAATNNDALSYAAGVVYSFSKKTMAYAAYHEMDVDNDGGAADVTAYAAGIRHTF